MDTKLIPKNNNIIDIIRGIAFILMLIHHIFYFYDITHNTSDSSHPIISNIGNISRHIFIFLTGFLLSYAYKQNSTNYIFKRVKRSLQILLAALLITIITYIYYPNKFIRFGILHFLGLSTLILAPIVPYKQLYIIILFISIILHYNINKIPSINPTINTILGSHIHYNMIDYFSLLNWLPLLILGMMFGSLNINLDIFDNFDFINKPNIISALGKKSLELYIIHIIILIVYYNHCI